MDCQNTTDGSLDDDWKLCRESVSRLREEIMTQKAMYAEMNNEYRQYRSAGRNANHSKDKLVSGWASQEATKNDTDDRFDRVASLCRDFKSSYLSKHELEIFRGTDEFKQSSMIIDPAANTNSIKDNPSHSTRSPINKSIASLFLHSTTPPVSIRSTTCLSASFKAKWLLASVRQAHQKTKSKHAYVNNESIEIIDVTSSNVRDRLVKHECEAIIAERLRIKQIERERRESIERKRRLHEEWMTNRPAWNNEVKSNYRTKDTDEKSKAMGHCRLQDFKINFCSDNCSENCDCYNREAKADLKASKTVITDIKEPESVFTRYDHYKLIDRNRSNPRDGSSSLDKNIERTRQLIYKPTSKPSLEPKFGDSIATVNRSPLRRKKFNEEANEMNDDRKRNRSRGTYKSQARRGVHSSHQDDDPSNIVHVHYNLHCLSGAKDYETPNLSHLYRTRRAVRSKTIATNNQIKDDVCKGEPRTHHSISQARHSCSQHQVNASGHHLLTTDTRHLGQSVFRGKISVDYDSHDRGVHGKQRYSFSLTKIC